MSSFPYVFNAPFGDGWIKDKKLVMSCLRAFGCGSNNIGEENVLRHVDYLTEYILNLGDLDIDLNSLIFQTNTNIILKILLNKRFDLDDQFLKEFIQQWKDSLAVDEMEMLICSCVPVWLVKLFARKMIPRVLQTTDVLMDFFRKEVDEHIKTLDKDNPRDFIDMYIVNQGCKLRLDHLTSNAYMFCGDPIITVGSAIQWVILYAGRNRQGI